MKTRLLVALPFLLACSSSTTGSGDASTSSTSSGTTSSSTGGGGSGGDGQHASSCGPDLGTLSPALWGRRYDTHLDGLIPQQITVNGDGESVLLGHANDDVDFGTGVPQDHGPVLGAYDAAGAPLAAASMDSELGWGALFRGADLYTTSTEAGSLDILLEKRSAALATTWLKHVGVATSTPATPYPPFLGPLVARPDGSMVFAGAASGMSLQIGTTTMVFDQPDAFVVALDPEGDVLWAVQLGLVFDAPTNGLVNMHATAVDPSGAIAFTGLAVLSSPTTTSTSFFAKLDATGAVLWSRVLPVELGVGSAGIIGLAIAPDGSVIADGAMGGTVDLGGGPITAEKGSRFVARYDPAGALAQVVFTTEGCAAPHIVGWTKSGDLAVLGWGVDGALYRGTLDPVTLAPSYTHGYAISAPYAPIAAIAPSGSLLISGTMNGPSDFGQGPDSPTNPNKLQAFFAALP